MLALRHATLRARAFSRRIGVALSLLLAGGLAPAWGQASGTGLYRLDPAHSFVTFEVLHFGTATLRGRLGPVQGFVTLDRQGAGSQASITVPLATLDTGVAPLDTRLARPDLFDTAAHPVAWFVARQFAWSEDGRLTQVRGEFTLKGVAQGVTLTASRFNCYPHPMLGREVCGGDFEATLRRSDFRMGFGAPFVSDTVRVLVQVEGIRD